MRQLFSRAMATSLALVTAAALTALQSLPAQAANAVCNADSRLTTVLKRGKLLAGVRFDYPPAGSVDAEGNSVGFGPDIAREFAKHLGVPVEFVQVTDGTRFELLKNGSIDAEFGITTPTKTRNEVVDFTDPYIWDRGVILVRQGESVKSADYFNDSKTIIGATQGGLYADVWREAAPTANMSLFQEFPDVVAALIAHKVDVALMTEIGAYKVLKEMGDQAKGLVVGDVFYQDSLAIMVSQNDSKWRNYISWGLQRLWAEGTFQQLYKKAFGVDPAFELWHNGRLQPGVTTVGKECDPW